MAGRWLLAQGPETLSNSEGCWDCRRRSRYFHVVLPWKKIKEEEEEKISFHYPGQILGGSSLALKQDPSLLWKDKAGKFRRKKAKESSVYFTEERGGSQEAIDGGWRAWGEHYLFSSNFSIYVILDLKWQWLELIAWVPPVKQLTTFMKLPEMCQRLWT